MTPEELKPTNMKPERSEDIEIMDGWTVHPPYISQELEFDSFNSAMKFGDFVHDAGKNWDAEVDVAAHGTILTIEVSPAKGEVLTDTTHEFVRGIAAAYKLFQAGPIPRKS